LFLIYCKIHEKDGFIIINSTGGKVAQLSAILTAYQDSGVHLTVIGTGFVASCAAGLFCMADERILTPRTKFLVHHSNHTYEKKTTITFPIEEREYEYGKKCEEIVLSAYTKKTSISREVFERKCKNGKDWFLSDAEIQKYGITTRSSDGWLDILANAMKKED
jgi:ATP-dependent protease ClpP protease subunit